MQRYNGFSLIHKALRAMLYDSALCIQQTYFADTDEAEIALEKTENVLQMFEQHAHHEDTFILPSVEQFEPSLAEEFEKEHVEDISLANRLKNLVIIYRNLNFSEERLVAGSAIIKTFVEFMVFNLNHMAKEEVLLNNALWKHYTDEQIIALNQKLVASIPRQELAIAGHWMIRSINNNDAITWLKEMRKTAPSFAYDALISMVNKELPAYRSTAITEALKEEEDYYAVY